MAPPDADIYPEATGQAIDTVKAHQSPAPLTLYAGWFCPFVQRVWLVLEEKRIPYQYIEVNPYHKPDSLLKLNPRGLVPTLEYDGKPLYESTVVVDFLEEAYPDHGSVPLYPKDPYEKARQRIWIDYVTSRIIPAYHRFLQFQIEEGGREGFEKVKSEFLGHLREWIKEADPEGPFFAGKEPGAIDFSFAPWVIRTWVFDEFKGGSGIPKEGEKGDDEVWKRWRKFAEAIENRKSIKETTSEPEYYKPLYKRYADNIAQSELAKSIRAGRGVV
ncbi:Glutathione s-transferase [Lasiodiplodia theobromae]|uniref:Glutathione S-transferase omega-1 n=1 Tax=Lasiodiplodia theobromae TaxID=45133 RepID=A0A5N5DCZ1_9PEZI|nr:Glutathione s-transferase [Lasiodiplodia theobromae]KAB2575300.1 Glutathione S-transferase omega-1 [Lasiodiplodia theobromae]KAF4539491.1 Glutathione s-transferase [Lasiodiplodia theobromae]